MVELLAQPRLGLMGDADVARMRQTLAALPVAAQADQMRRACRAFLKG